MHMTKTHKTKNTTQHRNLKIGTLTPPIIRGRHPVLTKGKLFLRLIRHPFTYHRSHPLEEFELNGEEENPSIRYFGVDDERDKTKNAKLI